MKCCGCDKKLSIKEELANTDEDFIDNKCLCRDCLSISNEEVNRVRNEKK